MFKWFTGQEKEKTHKGVERSRQTWFGGIKNLLTGSAIDDSVWDQLEEILLGADVGYELTETFLSRLRERAKRGEFQNGEDIRLALKAEMLVLLQHPENQSSNEPDRKTPRVILIVGVNGSGKTTSIAILANLLKNQGDTVLLAAADTFRAGAIDQLKIWGNQLDVDVIAHSPGADPGAVAFDAVQAGKSRNRDAILIDTAGRLHTKSDLMEELKKINRVVERTLPDVKPEVLLVLDATTGQNGLTQATEFTNTVKVNGTILTKLDGTARGGIVFAIQHSLGIPVAFIGVGEQIDDLIAFDPNYFVNALLEEDD